MKTTRCSSNRLYLELFQLRFWPGALWGSLHTDFQYRPLKPNTGHHWPAISGMGRVWQVDCLQAWYRLVRKALHDLTSVSLYSYSYYYLHECTQHFSKPDHVSQIGPSLPSLHTWAFAVPPTRKEELPLTASPPFLAQPASQSLAPVSPWNLLQLHGWKQFHAWPDPRGLMYVFYGTQPSLHCTTALCLPASFTLLDCTLLEGWDHANSLTCLLPFSRAHRIILNTHAEWQKGPITQ